MPLGSIARPSDVRILFGENVEIPENGDEHLNRLLEIASDHARELTGRMFSSREENVTRSYRVTKEGVVYIDELMGAGDVISVSSPLGAVIADYYEVSPEGYPARGSYLYLTQNFWPDYSSLPPEHLNFFTTNLHGLPSGKSVWEYPGARLSVTGNFGYDEYPRTLRNLIARAVAIWWRDDIDTGGRGGVEEEQTFEPQEHALPPMIVAQLERSWMLPGRVS